MTTMEKPDNPAARPRIGVYVCHCGTNIAKTVDCDEVARMAGGGAVKMSTDEIMALTRGRD